MSELQERRSGTPEYAAFRGMWRRCTNPTHSGYHRYGGRGISVCERWRNFDAFLADMGRKPSARHSIDRINNDGNYEPANCRWATPEQQQGNTINTHLVTFRGETAPFRVMSAKYGLKEQTAMNRLRHGWDFERLFTTPVNPNLAANGRKGNDKRWNAIARQRGEGKT